MIISQKLILNVLNIMHNTLCTNTIRTCIHQTSTGHNIFYITNIRHISGHSAMRIIHLSKSVSLSLQTASYYTYTLTYTCTIRQVNIIACALCYQ